MKKKNQEDKCCGLCAWFYAEDTYGCGCCPHEFAELKACEMCCTNEHFVSREQMRHYMAVLVQANRYLRDEHVPAIYRSPNTKELGKAIDFAVEYMKIFSQL